MVSVIKDICIFMIIAQAILFFVPNNSYMKYVRILVGIIMIFRMTQPLFGLILSEEEQTVLLEQITSLEENMKRNQQTLNIEDNRMGIYRSIEEEIRNRLCQCEIEEYEVTKVELAGAEQSYTKEGEPENIYVTLRPKKRMNGEIDIRVEQVRIGQEQSQPFTQEKQLKQIFGDCLGVSPDRFKITTLD